MGLKMRVACLLGLLVAPIVSAAYGQLPLQSEQYDAGLFTPLEDLHALSALEYTALRHPKFPAYSVRIKESRVCDGEVRWVLPPVHPQPVTCLLTRMQLCRSYTGYIDIQARHLFFYFFESRNDPDTDDVVFWTNGGPGGSSGLGLFMELGRLLDTITPRHGQLLMSIVNIGPCRITAQNTTERFEYSWNDRANIFFIDQPIGVGFSYADYGEQVVGIARDGSAFYLLTSF